MQDDVSDATYMYMYMYFPVEVQQCTAVSLEPVLLGKRVVSVHESRELGVPHLHRVECVDDS